MKRTVTVAVLLLISTQLMSQESNSTKTTTTETMSIDMPGMPGVKMEVKTETSHESSSSSTGSVSHQSSKQNTEPKKPAVMSSSDFNKLLSHLKKEKFEDTKLNIMKSAIAKKNINIDQFVQLIKIYTFDDSQIESFKIGYPRLIDKDNIYQAYSVFEFDATKEEVQQWAETQ